MSSIFNNPISIRIIEKLICAQNSLSDNIDILRISDSNNSKEFSLCDYIKGPKPEPKNGLVLLTKAPLEGFLCLIVQNPQLEMIKVIEYVNSLIGFKKNYYGNCIHETVKIGMNVVIEDNVEIGQGTILEHNCVIHANTKIGKNCLIRTNSSIGGDGFGFINIDSGYVKQPHLGGVILGDNVEIGANCCVVRGIINPTRVDNNVKVDNLVHIAHDCHIKDSAFIIAGAVLCGYVTIGKRSRVAPNATIKQRVVIGDDAIVGLSSVVLKNVKDNETVFGNPAKSLRKFNK